VIFKAPDVSKITIDVFLRGYQKYLEVFGISKDLSLKISVKRENCKA